MSFIETKSLLAKLMATENLTVEHRNVDTASFDVKRRVLTLPLFANLSPNLADLLVGHEVGHALYTPEELLLTVYEKKIAKSVANVIEDVRIEKKIKNTYPGLRVSFIKGYRELVDKDFFGTAGLDLNDLNFIDRVNMHHKAGAGCAIKFKNEKEIDLLSEINATETPEDVISVAIKVMEYLKEEKEEKKKKQEEEKSNTPEENDDSDGDGENDDYESSHEEFSDYDDEEDQGNPNKHQNNDGYEQEEDDDESTSGSNEIDDSTDEEKEDDDIVSHTDEEFRKNENKLFENSQYEYYYGNIPNIDLDEAIVDYKVLWNRFRTWYIDNSFNSYSEEMDKEDIKNFQKIRMEANKVVGYLAKEFEMRKNAEQMKRASVSKTGELDMKRVFNYQLTDDIFKKMTIVPDGKSHGLIMFIDWSGSMRDHISNTIKQLINLVLFCKKINIPYEVYAFTDNYDFSYGVKPVEGDIAFTNHFNLMNILSSRMSANDFTYACSKLTSFGFSNNTKYNDRYFPRWFYMSATPLNEAVICAMKIVPEFQKKYKLQIVNTVFLTDGEGHDLDRVYKSEEEYGKKVLIPRYGDTRSKYLSKCVVRDPVSKHQVEILTRGRGCTSAYIKLLKKRTNCNIIGFYVLSGREFGSTAREFFSNAANFDKLKTDFRKNKYQVVTSAGFDEYYLLRSESMNTEEENEFSVKENATTRGLVSAFSKYTTNRLSNRVVLNRFIGLIT
jgi:hypothetical protein